MPKKIKTTQKPAKKPAVCHHPPGARTPLGKGMFHCRLCGATASY
jgi:hypothetical protein